MVSLGKRGTLTARKRALSVLRQKKHVQILFDEIASQCQDRNSGYTRIVKLGKRRSDSSEMAFLEWVSVPRVSKKKPKKAERKEAASS
jgi:large subunit ribosomal protein L17